jgi:hypothetical protein
MVGDPSGLLGCDVEMIADFSRKFVGNALTVA